jgi:lipopolysaccharide/colanic/teichoic acid biosynthesis glycosyltransferase
VLSVPPGITDFASIRYRNESELLGRCADAEAHYVRRVLPRKLRYYRFYVQHRSLLLDFKLIALTLCAILERGPRR